MSNVHNTQKNNIMQITKINNQGELVDLIDLETDTIPENLYNDGYRIADEEQPPEPERTVEDYEEMMIYVPVRYYDAGTDTNRIGYRRIYDESAAEVMINDLQTTLGETDYIITKISESMIMSAIPMTSDDNADTNIPSADDLGLEKYDLGQILASRASLRNKIRALRTAIEQYKNNKNQ